MQTKDMLVPHVPTMRDADYMAEHYGAIVVTAALVLSILVTAGLTVPPAIAIGLMIARKIMGAG